jgi:ribosomal protein L16/L10AE
MILSHYKLLINTGLLTAFLLFLFTGAAMWVKFYKELHGHYPELVQVDKIYATRENRSWLKERNIRITAPPLGRRKNKETQTYYQKQKRRKEAAERNHIEGKFGQGKNGYNLNEIRARLKNTSESWISCIFFIMNLILYEKKFIFGSILEKANNMVIKIMEQVGQIKMLFIPKKVYLSKKFNFELLLR